LNIRWRSACIRTAAVHYRHHRAQRRAMTEERCHMTDYRERFKSCGKNVRLAGDVYIEHPEVMEVGDNVHFMKGFYMMDGPQVCRIGNDVNFYPNCFIQG